jgi:hypothetical protein
MKEVIRGAEVILLGTKSVDKKTLEVELRPDQLVIDLVNLEKENRCRQTRGYEGICW